MPSVDCAHTLKQRRNSLICTGTAILSATALYFSITAIIAFSNESSIDPPAHRLKYSGDTAVTALTALHSLSPYIGEALIQLNVDPSDTKDFQLHAHNIAVANGWIPHAHQNLETKILVPQDQIPSLEEAAKDPYAWLSAQDQTQPASTVHTDNIAVVILTTSSPPLKTLGLVAANVSLFTLTILTAGLTIVFYRDSRKFLPKPATATKS